MMTIVTARGCPFKCTFCVHRQGPYYRARNMDNIMQEIELLYEQYEFNILLFLDELFAVNKQRMHDFCATLLEARNKKGWDFGWCFQTHASASLDQDVLKLAKEAGCYSGYGLESASPRVLKSMNKKSRPEQISKAIGLADSVGLGFGGNFIFGDEAETPETINESVTFFSRYCRDIHVQVYFILLYPGSKLFENRVAKGLVPDRLDFYDKIDERLWNMTSMPDKLFLPWVYLLYYLFKGFHWVKSTEALNCIKDYESSDNPMSSYLGKSVFNIQAACPHCGAKVVYQELLDKIQENNKQRTVLEGGRQILRSIKSVFASDLNKMIFKLCLKNAFSYLLIIRHPLFKELRPFVEEECGKAFVITGCSSCNKRMKINLPLKYSHRRPDLFVRKLVVRIIRGLI